MGPELIVPYIPANSFSFNVVMDNPQTNIRLLMNIWLMTISFTVIGWDQTSLLLIFNLHSFLNYRTRVSHIIND